MTCSTFVDGPTTFKEMVRVIRTAKSRGHYIYLLGWWMSYAFELIPGDHEFNDAQSGKRREPAS